MAVKQALLVHKDGDSHRVALYRVNGVTNKDTIDVAEDFHKVSQAVAVQLTSELADFHVTVSVRDTVLTINGPGLDGDAVQVLVCGGSR